MKQIAHELGRQEGYVRQRASLLYRKFGVSNRYELLARHAEHLLV
jgi:DNA-binding NarL/FixJ family response regulator